MSNTLSPDELNALLGAEDSPVTAAASQTQVGGFWQTATERLTPILSTVHPDASFTRSNFSRGALSQFKSDLQVPMVQARIGISGSLMGEWIFLFPQADALLHANALMQQPENTELTELVLSTLGDLANQMSAPIAQSFEQLGRSVTLSTSDVQLLEDLGQLMMTAPEVYRFTADFGAAEQDFQLLAFAPASVMDTLFGTINSPGGSASNVAQPVQFPNMTGLPSKATDNNIALLLDVPMRVTVELGRRRMSIKDILTLGEGSIIELDKLAGEPVDILVNDKFIAQGEVVVIDENFAVRVTKIITSTERIFDRGLE